MGIASMSYGNRLVASVEDCSGRAALLPRAMKNESVRQAAAGLKRVWLLAQTMATVLLPGKHLKSVPVADRFSASETELGRATPRNTAPLRPLRVLHVIDGAGGIGRMVISGRMVDVCAEIDRLAAREARQARC